MIESQKKRETIEIYETFTQIPIFCALAIATFLLQTQTAPTIYCARVWAYTKYHIRLTISQMDRVFATQPHYYAARQFVIAFKRQLLRHHPCHFAAATVFALIADGIL